MRRVLDLVRPLLPIRREERGLAILLYVLLSLMVLSDWVGKVGANALFVKRFGVEYIPLMYVITPIAMLATSALLFAFLDHVRRRTLLAGYIAAVMVASLAIQIALPLGGIVLPVAYVFAHGVKETIYLLFWVYVGNLYDGEQSQRLFPFFAGAVLIGKIFGGVAATALVPVIHSENFMGAQAVGFLVCLMLILLYRDRLPEGRGAAQSSAPRAAGIGETVRNTIDGYRAVTSDELLKVLGVGVFLWYLLMQMGNYLYLVGLDVLSTLPVEQQSEDAFSQAYASVYTGGSLVALGIQTFLTGALLRRLGVGLMLFLLPLWYLAAFTGALIAFNFVAAVAIQLGERVIVHALHRPTTELVYNQVAENIRPRARTFLSGGVNALGNLGAAAMLLAAAATGICATSVLGLAGMFSVVFVVNAWSLRRTYGRRIAANLASDVGELRWNALQVLARERSAVPVDALLALAVAPLEGLEGSLRVALKGGPDDSGSLGQQPNRRPEEVGP